MSYRYLCIYLLLVFMAISCKTNRTDLKTTEAIYGVTTKDYEKNLSISDIEGRIKSELEYKKPMKVEQVLELLPKEMHKNFVVSLNSQSRQESSNQFPRIISFMPNGSLIASFNGHSKHEANNEVEAIEFDKTTDEMNFFRIILSKDPSSDRHYQVIKNPDVCFDCHGTRDAPIPQWGHYPEWPNILGSFDDFLLPEGDQRTEISRAEDTCAGSLTVDLKQATIDESLVVQNNRDKWKVHPRYKFFFANDRGNLLYPYSDNFRGKFSLRPNLRLGTVLHRRFIKDRLSRMRAKNNNLYDYATPLYLYDQFKCSGIMPNAKAKRGSILRAVKSRFPKSQFTASGNWQDEFLSLFGENFKGLDFNPNGKSSPNGFFSGFVNSRQLIATYLYRSLSLKIPEIAPYANETDINACYPGYGSVYAKFIVKLGGRLAPEPGQEAKLCRALAEIYDPSNR